MEFHVVKVKYSYLASEILLSFLLTYYYLSHAFIFLEIEIYTVSIATILMLMMFVSFVLLVTVRHHKTFSFIEYVLIILLILYAIMAYRVTHRIWFKNFYLYWGLFSVFIGIMMSREKQIHPLVFWIPFLVVMGSLVIEYILHPESLKDMRVYAMHRNVLPMIATTFGMLITMNYAIQHKLDSKLSLLFPYLLLFVNYYSNSRAGLIIGMMYVLIVYGNFFFHFTRFHWDTAENKKRVILWFLLWLVLTASLFTLLILNSRLVNEGFSDNGRMEIYEAFQEEVEVQSVSTGVAPAAAVKIADHLHNSFLQLFSYSGFFAFPMFFIMLMTVKHLLLERNFLILLFGITIIYSLGEYYMFLKHGDLILFPLIVYAFHERRRNLRLRRNDKKSVGDY
jgi:hypothetical protein